MARFRRRDFSNRSKVEYRQRARHPRNELKKSATLSTPQHPKGPDGEISPPRLSNRSKVEYHRGPAPP